MKAKKSMKQSYSSKTGMAGKSKMAPKKGEKKDLPPFMERMMAAKKKK
jgi:hypothetical protein